MPIQQKDLRFEKADISRIHTYMNVDDNNNGITTNMISIIIGNGKRVTQWWYYVNQIGRRPSNTYPFRLLSLQIFPFQHVEIGFLLLLLLLHLQLNLLCTFCVRFVYCVLVLFLSLSITEMDRKHWWKSVVRIYCFLL